MMVGECRLCRKRSELRDSHFIPQAAYKRVRGEGKNPHPLVVQTDKAFQTADQIRAHLLALRHVSVFSPGHKIVLLAKKQEAMMAATYREHLSVVARMRTP
jgi:hypothetical protein